MFRLFAIGGGGAGEIKGEIISPFRRRNQLVSPRTLVRAVTFNAFAALFDAMSGRKRSHSAIVAVKSTSIKRSLPVRSSVRTRTLDPFNKHVRWNLWLQLASKLRQILLRVPPTALLSFPSAQARAESCAASRNKVLPLVFLP